MSTVTVDTLETRLLSMAVRLIETARDLAWNKISDNCMFILSHEVEYIGKNFREQDAMWTLVNDKKQPQCLSGLMPQLKEMLADVYEIDMYIYRALRNSTIIEIRYILNDARDPDWVISMKENLPLMHCKVAHPVYRGFDNKKRFDINWPRNPLGHRWKLFWFRMRYEFEVMFKRRRVPKK